MTAPWTTARFGEMVQRVRTSDLENNYLSAINQNVEDLCSQYSTGEPGRLMGQAETELARIDQLLNQRLTLVDHRTLLVDAGWLALLLAALAYDQGMTGEAEAARQLAMAIGQDTASPSILGWAHETAVWIDIANGNWDGAITKATTGLGVAGDNEPTGVSIQLALERAEASARKGDTAGMHRSLALARRLLGRHETPANPRNHFRFDHSKFDLREMRTLLIVGQDTEAEQIAIRLDAELRNPDGSSRHPMRTSELLASRGLIEARRGNVKKAVEFANAAIDIGRRSRLSFQQITSAVATELAKHHDDPAVQQFLDRRVEVLGFDAHN